MLDYVRVINFRIIIINPNCVHYYINCCSVQLYPKPMFIQGIYGGEFPPKVSKLCKTISLRLLITGL